jgi:hypothetical protein
MIGITALGGLVTLIALAMRAQAKERSEGHTTGIDESTPKPYAGGLPEDVKKIVIRHARGANPPTKTELELAASSASMAGYDKLGDELYNQAKNAPVDGPRRGVPSPIPQVSDADWTKFVKKMATAKVSDASPKGVGMFQMTIRRLTDFGVLANPKKTNGVWSADWLIPKEKVLSDPKLQYKLFERSMVAYAKTIKSKFDASINTEYEDHPATLSGLLAVAHAAGENGLGKWIANDPPRSKFKTTTAAYLSANGIF